MFYSSPIYMDHVVHYVPRTYLSYSWIFVPFDYFPSGLPTPPSTSVNHGSNLFSFGFNFHMWDDTLFLFLCLTSFSIMSRYIHVVTTVWFPIFVWQCYCIAHTHTHTHTYTYHNFCMHRFINRYLVCFYAFAVVNNADNEHGGRDIFLPYFLYFL